MLLALWVGFIPFVGPYFDYQLGTDTTWTMTSDHFWLSVLPAVAIFVGGWMLVRSFGRSTASLGGLLAFAGSFWLVIGPNFAQLWKDGQLGHTPAFGGTGLQVAEWLGFHYAVGALGILLAAYAMGYFAGLPILARRIGERERERRDHEVAPAPQRATAGTATGATAGTAAGATAGRTTAPATGDEGTARHDRDRVGPDGQPVERERITGGEREAEESRPRRRRFRNPLTRA